MKRHRLFFALPEFKKFFADGYVPESLICSNFQLLTVQRLFKVIIGALLHGINSAFPASTSGNDNHESIGIEDLQLLQRIDTVAAGKHEIQQHELIFIGNFNARPDVAPCLYLIAEGSQCLTYDPYYALIIIYNKQPFTHFLPHSLKDLIVET